MSVKIRPGKVEDAHSIANVHATSWQHTYRGIVAQSHLDAMDPDKTVESWRKAITGEAGAGTHMLVAQENEMIIGFAVYGPAREPAFGYAGELYAAYFLPDAMGKGLGTQMIRLVSRDLAIDGLKDMIVWAMEANARGCRFYETTLGGVLVPASRKHFEIAGGALWEVAYGFRPLPLLE